MATARVPVDEPTLKPGEVLVMWVDANTKDDNTSNRHTIESIQKVCPNLKTFTNGEQFANYIKDIRTGRMFSISSGALGKEVARSSGTHDKIEAMFIFCGNPALHESWAKSCTKIKGVHNRIQPICEALKTLIGDQAKVVPSTSKSADTFGLDQLEPSFLSMVLFQHAILKIEHDPQAQKTLADYSRTIFADNKDELELVDEFRKDYRPEKAIWWYTRESFVYRMVNRALRMMEVDVVVKMAFFIKDLHRQIEKLNKEQLPSYKDKPFDVYRGQGMNSTDFRRLSKNTGGAISYNSFVSTSRRKDIGVTFANQAARQADLCGVLFVMTIDPKITAVPFAELKDHDHLKGEESVLFSMNSVFRIDSVKPFEDSTRIYEARLTLAKVADEDLKSQIKHLDRKMGDGASWKDAVDFFLERKDMDLAGQLCQTILEQPISDRDKSPYYNCLGMIQELQNKCQEALQSYECALTAEEKALSPKDPQLALARYNIGMLYCDCKEYDKAFSSLQKALAIWQQSYSISHPQILIVNRLIKKVEALKKQH